MAETAAEKTEKPTPKRINKARDEGNVAKTVELNSAVILLTGAFLLFFMMGSLIRNIIMFFHAFWGEIPSFVFTVDNFQKYMAAGCLKLALMLAPLLLSLLVAGILINIIQSGFLFTTKVLTPKLEKLNPISGFKRLFSSRGLMELFKNIVKLIMVGLVAYWTIKADFEFFIPLLDQQVGQIVSFLGLLVFKVAIRTGIMILILAIFDFIWVKYKYIKDLKMSKQEVKEEHRQAEGPPEIRSKMKSVQFQQAMNRMMRDVPSAEVVITNPTHYAVALRYDKETMDAPVIVAKGARKLAAKIKQIAEENDIPIVENKPLARSLYRAGFIGQMIQPEFFAAVAEVLAFVYNMKSSRAARVA